MKLDKMKKEDLEVLSNKEITTLILKEEKKAMSTADLYKRIIELLELPESTFENKIADFYTQLATDKNFILLDSGLWDLSVNHKKGITTDDEDEEEEEEESEKEDLTPQEDEDNYDDYDDFDDDSQDEDLKDLVIIDEDELDLDN